MPKLLAEVAAWWAREAASAAPACTPEQVELVQRLRRGEREAIAAVYRQHHAVLRAFARRITGDDLAAEDLIQDVFVQLPRLAARFRGQSQFGTFLVGVAASLSRRYVQTSTRRRRALQRLAFEPREAAAALAPDAAILPALYAALDALPLAQRTAFVLYEVEERSAKEVALMLGVPEATVRTRCFHARQKLRTQLERAGLCQARKGDAP